MTIYRSTPIQTIDANFGFVGGRPAFTGGMPQHQWAFGPRARISTGKGVRPNTTLPGLRTLRRKRMRMRMRRNFPSLSQTTSRVSQTISFQRSRPPETIKLTNCPAMGGRREEDDDEDDPMGEFTAHYVQNSAPRQVRSKVPSRLEQSNRHAELNANLWYRLCRRSLFFPVPSCLRVSAISLDPSDLVRQSTRFIELNTDL